MAVIAAMMQDDPKSYHFGVYNWGWWAYDITAYEQWIHWLSAP
jgi:hypothetical protein